MTEIHKLICNECKRKKDLLKGPFDSYDYWQTLRIRHEPQDYAFSSTILILNFCSIKCVKAFLKHYKEAEYD